MSASSDHPTITDANSSRPSLSTSVTDFALHSLSTSPFGPTSHSPFWDAKADPPADTGSFLNLQRLRRQPQNAGSKGFIMHSPLATSFSVTSPKRRRASIGGSQDAITQEFELYRDKDNMITDSSPSSESDIATPPKLEPSLMEDGSDRRLLPSSSLSRSFSPSGPNQLGTTMSMPTGSQPESRKSPLRRLSHPLRPTRLMTLMVESRAEDNEVKSEAQFQRFVASFSGLAARLGLNKASTSASDKGRYPEEAEIEDEVPRDETPSDEGDFDEGYFPPKPPVSTSEPINIAKSVTPALDEYSLSLTGSPGNAMDVDTPSVSNGSPSCSSLYPTPWRQTPPPTAVSAVRTNKRKYDDRFDPYAPSAKRRAASPSLSQRRDVFSMVSPITIPRSPILRPRASFSQSASATSSPTISQPASSYYTNTQIAVNSSTSTQPSNNGHTVNKHHRTGSMSSSVASSPTVRASMILASPILRPVTRLSVSVRKGSGELEGEKDIEGAGDGVSSMNLGGG